MLLMGVGSVSLILVSVRELAQRESPDLLTVPPVCVLFVSREERNQFVFSCSFLVVASRVTCHGQNSEQAHSNFGVLCNWLWGYSFSKVPSQMPH